MAHQKGGGNRQVNLVNLQSKINDGRITAQEIIACFSKMQCDTASTSLDPLSKNIMMCSVLSNWLPGRKIILSDGQSFLLAAVLP